MAYSNAIVINHLGGRDFAITITELEAGAATEATITGLPIKGQIVAQRSQLTSGTATTVDPILGIASNPASNFIDLILSNGTAGAGISNLASPPVPYITTNGHLYHRSICDAGSDNSVTTVYLLKAGW